MEPIQTADNHPASIVRKMSLHERQIQKDTADAAIAMPINVTPGRQPAIGNASHAPARYALIVSGDSASARLCEETLRRMGFEISRMNSGVAAVVAARGRVPTLIFIDLQLSDASASETIGWLRANQALVAVPIVVLRSAEELGLPNKAIRTISKPPSSVAIEQAVKDLCG